MEMEQTQNYIKSFLLNDDEEVAQYIHYGMIEIAPANAKLIIIPSNFFEESVYGTKQTLPALPLKLLSNSDIPFLFGESKIEKTNGKTILYADLIASAYFMLSRYEEIIKPESRDQHGRFLAKDSVVFQAGYGMRPLVDEWGRYLRNLLRECSVDLPEEKQWFSKIYLTHDVDVPFFFSNFRSVLKETIKHTVNFFVPLIAKRVFKSAPEKKPFRSYFFAEKHDRFYTFPRIIKYDDSLKNNLPENLVETIYFIIAKGSLFTDNRFREPEGHYFNVFSLKFKRLLKLLKSSGANMGLHVSYEAGKDSALIKNETKRLVRLLRNKKFEQLKSRHHYLRWCEAKQIVDMEKAGITDDFTLGYADSVGFRVGTCKPYRFINPITKQLTNVVVHPTEIMECSLYNENYMNLPGEKALALCKKLAEEVYKHNGEFVILFHNSSFIEEFYAEKLYEDLLEHIRDMIL